ncbi:membrane protein [Coprinopsis sp. MPI-PUGE-AT-0042]|nr:membrane protein [Coprinopsis sp. MPI-PUGE-AT-0042]
MLSVGALIWISFRPLLRLVITVGAGFIITKADIFPLTAARGCSQVLLYITIPCLMFSKIVPSFNQDNISAFGPLFLVGSLYQILGILAAWIIRQVFWVPHRFRNGILVAGGWGNVGDIPTSVIMSITAAAPFTASKDQDLSVAYISVFILVFTISLFPMGGQRWIIKDFEGPDVEPEEVQEKVRQRRKKLLGWAHITRSKSRRDEESGEKREDDAPSHDNDATLVASSRLRRTSVQDHTCIAPKPSIPSDLGPLSRQQTMDDTVVVVDTSKTPPSDVCDEKVLHERQQRPSSSLQSLSKLKRFLSHVRKFVAGVLSPPSISILIALPISLIPQLKALFVVVQGVDMPSAPDGQPPLAFIMDAAAFIGAASVPLGLICLGTLPVGAISSLAVAKLLVMPVIGVLINQGLVYGGIIPREDKVLRLVCIFCSCLPTATTQVYLTQVYSGTGSAEHLSAFLIPQYILMFFSMTALTAYTINLLF